MNKKHTETFLALVEDGKMELYNKPYFENFIKQLDNGKYDVTIKKHRKVRSKEQNAYYHGVVVQYWADKEEVTPQEAHEFLGYLHRRTEYRCPVSDELHERIVSTTKLNTRDFELYMEACRSSYYEQNGMQIPLPRDTQYNY